jgi:sec-independent protein translocase protein TatB
LESFVAMGVQPVIQVASFGIQDSLFLMLLALVVFGPRRLPEIGRQIGKLMYEFRKVSNDFKFQMEEELRASEEADRQRKLQAAIPASTADPAPASTQVTLDVPPHPVSEAPPLEPETVPAEGEVQAPSGVEATTDEPGEVQGEPQKFPSILPPASGEVIAAARPFRGRGTEPVADTGAETVTESGSEPTHTAAIPVVVADEGRVGAEVQPGVSAEQDAHHA